MARNTTTVFLMLALLCGGQVFAMPGSRKLLDSASAQAYASAFSSGQSSAISQAIAQAYSSGDSGGGGQAAAVAIAISVAINTYGCSAVQPTISIAQSIATASGNGGSST
ncbi:hypothetical protein WJX73_010414 [Symbiochloris irregularis]|uniref:Uncharacterized protein n=1 Tax=Symbiochloris irregularis TaxID=706552 RepID=A0AAW1PVU2_9CHLO